MRRPKSAAPARPAMSEAGSWELGGKPICHLPTPISPPPSPIGSFRLQQLGGQLAAGGAVSDQRPVELVLRLGQGGVLADSHHAPRFKSQAGFALMEIRLSAFISPYSKAQIE
ncbi:MAG: hypothetical protein WCJ07_02860 [Verrucomicrobiota bacterium]